MIRNVYICLMDFLKRFFQFYIFSNIHVALGTYCLVKITLLEHHIDENTTPLFVMFSTIVSYNFIRFFRMNEIVGWFSSWMKRVKNTLYILTFISVLIVVFLAFKIQIKAFLWLFPFALFTFFYGLPLPIKNKALRDVSGMKLFLIALSYAGITVFFPLIQNNVEIDVNSWITFAQRFLFIVLITIPFDIRDLHVDSKSLKTLPQSVGVKKSKGIGVLFGLLFVMLAFFKQPIDQKQLITTLIVNMVSILFLINAKDKQSKYYAAFWVESIPIFWLLIVIFSLNM